MSSVVSQLDGTLDVKQIFSTDSAFAALRVDGSVVTWGDDAYGGDSSVTHYEYDYSTEPRTEKTIKDYSVASQIDGTIDVKQIFSTDSAFAALRVDGSVITWGDASFGGDSSVTHFDISTYTFVKDYFVASQLDGTLDVKQIFSTYSAFAALRVDGSVVTCGDEAYGGDSSAVAKQLNGSIDVTQIFSNHDEWISAYSGAFAALRVDGSVVTWGDALSGGNSSVIDYNDATKNYSVANQLNGSIDVKQIFSNSSAFAALRVDGSVVTWGDALSGGDSSVTYSEYDYLTQKQKTIKDDSVARQLNGTIDVKEIFSTDSAFAALRADGSVITWGNASFGGDSSAIAKQLARSIDIQKIFSTDSAFAALRVDGSVITWGNSYGGDSSAVAKQLDGTIDVKQIFPNAYAFAALRVDGSVVTWGDASSGGDSSVYHYDDAKSTYIKDYSIAKQLDGTIDVTQIFSNDSAFAALRVDGSVVTWGDASYGVDSSEVTKQLDGTIDVKQIFSSYDAFAALRVDGSVITWGDALSGGNSSVIDYNDATKNYSVANQLNGSIDVKQIFSNSSAFAALRVDGSVVTWGDALSGGDSSVTYYEYDYLTQKLKTIKDDSVARQLNGTIDVTQIFSNSSAFAALRVDGSVVTWGYSFDGGDSSTVAKQLDGTIDVAKIFPMFLDPSTENRTEKLSNISKRFEVSGRHLIIS